jgi:hypothetical protein
MSSRRYLTMFNVFLMASTLLLGTGDVSAAEIDAESKTAETEEEKLFEEVVKGFDKQEGLFTLYRDPDNGTLMMEVRPEQLNREYIYFSYTENGVVAAGQFRGNYHHPGIFRLQKYYDRIEFVEENTRFYFDPDNALARSANANISDAVLASSKIVATSEAGDRYLINLDEVLLKESFHKVNPNPDPNKKPHEQFSLGKLSEDKTRYANVRAYPDNVNIQVNYVYDNESPYVNGGDEVTDPRSVTMTLQHSFVRVPDNNYKSRLDDARVGYFREKVTDLTSHDITPYRDLINRWHLERIDPTAELSDAKEPIVWWLENSTPVAYREPVTQGVLAWNLAFEQAGISNAIVVKQQPDDADWDAGDLRYNVLRWTSSPTPPFAGYGPSFTNPKTGQILGADIMLEDAFVSNRVRSTAIFEPGAASDLTVGALLNTSPKWSYCAASRSIAHGYMLARSTMMAMGTTANMGEMVEQALYELALHEVGHTLGLNHNMRASQLHNNQDIHDASITKGVLIGSVMDYAPVNLAPPGREQGDFYISKPGPYDVWAIQFGYDTTMEGDRRIAHLARSAEPQLAFGNDADDMRSPGKAIDPRVNVDDMSADAIAYAEDRFALVEETMTNLRAKLTKPGESWAEIRNAYAVLSREQRQQAGVVSRYIGGVYVDRTLAGDIADSSRPYTPVAEDRQRQAMALLKERVFSAGAFQAPEDLISHLAMQRRGFDHYETTEDPKIHALALAIQKEVLDHLLHPVVLSRITDTTLYGNTYDVNEVLSDLTSAIFEADLKGDINSYRQNLQIEYISRLLAIVGTEIEAKDKGVGYDFHTKSAALSQTRRVQSWMERYGKSSKNSATAATRNYVLYLIERALEQRG